MLNETKNKKITLLQAIFLFLTAIYTSNIRFVTKLSIMYAHQAAWLVSLCSMLVFVPLLYVLYKIMNKFKGQSFFDIMCRVFGKTIGHTVFIIQIIWLFILLTLYVTYAGEKLVSSTYVGTDVKLIFFLFLVIVGVMLRYGLQVLCRINTMIFIITVSQFMLILGFLFTDFSAQNITPISTLDIGPVFSTIVFPLTTFSYFSFIFIFNDQIELGKKNKGKFAFVAIFLTIVNTLKALAVLGVFGYELAKKMTYPFLQAVENITVFSGSSVLDSLFISSWGLQEFILVCFFAYCICRMIKHVFKLTSQTPVLTAILGFCFFFAVCFCDNIFELATFSEKVVTPVNLMLAIGVPFVLFITAKIRKLL
ncbi:MAG: GerAB/ArcD/ProY family transporter [Eubacteriales bacterium]|nr:GerAB/ArcD/ProY family transporter [Eubacteriales bacterium]